MNPQRAILSPVPAHAQFLEFRAHDSSSRAEVISAVAALVADESLIIGLGPGLVADIGGISGLKRFPDFGESSIHVPTTQHDLLVVTRGTEESQVQGRSQQIVASLNAVCSVERSVAGFKYDTGRDLTGYEDGTENPKGQDAVDAAIVQGNSNGPNGSSFVVVQQWLHDFEIFDGMSRDEQDNAIGRHRESNEEFDAPESAHVKRTAQESFTPEAFLVRRSLPWRDDSGCGLMFVAFGKSFDAFEVQFRRMLGLDDGIVDGLFQFSKPVSGSYYWCPPVGADECLDLSVVQE